ncbi:EMYY motif lipoprotein [Staphylococcus americanisciuri]|uniref:EMYY motif lipoprotein n=1 Tax=Staphylococcus americanisciuri TaxID=2973940 RepID=A0ABT2F3E6_9STAP|nr:EMYY motif lipoprotein [Staphylococcus americanisciuri]MCS4486405.1 EMYY motif lipoprotein [Staphylococcus americanisciuri]
MNKLLSVITLCTIIMFVLSACGGQTHHDKVVFDAQLKRVADKEKTFNQTLNAMPLDKLKGLRQSDTTDKNKKYIKQLDKQIKKQLEPQFQAYYKAVQQLPDENQQLKEIKMAYLKGMNGKKQEVQRLKDFITQYMASIDANEHILNETQAFESHRANVETYIAQAKLDGAEESGVLEKILETSNEKIKTSAEEASQHNDEQEAQIYQAETLPLIHQQIKELNQKQLHNNSVHQARQSAIEMYYSLESYYQARVKAIQYSEALSKIDTNTLITSSEQLAHYDEDYQQKYEAL